MDPNPPAAAAAAAAAAVVVHDDLSTHAQPAAAAAGCHLTCCSHERVGLGQGRVCGAGQRAQRYAAQPCHPSTASLPVHRHRPIATGPHALHRPGTVAARAQAHPLHPSILPWSAPHLLPLLPAGWAAQLADAGLQLGEAEALAELLARLTEEAPEAEEEEDSDDD